VTSARRRNMSFKEYINEKKKLPEKKKIKLKKILQDAGVTVPAINQVIAVMPTILNVLGESEDEI
jgi:hypothetical protein